MRIDARKCMAARLAPKKYGDRISHDVKGPGPNIQPAILIRVDGEPLDEFARQLAYEEGGGVLLDGNGDNGSADREFRCQTWSCVRRREPLAMCYPGPAGRT